jgi:hypothetical protein
VYDRGPVPILIFLILVVLTLGAAAGGLILAPPSADLVVNNAAGENLVAPSLSVHAVVTQRTFFGRFERGQPPIVRNVVFDPTEPADHRTAPVQAFTVGSLHKIADGSPWTAESNSYRYGGDIARFLGIPSRANVLGGTVALRTSGHIRTWVSGGFLAAYVVRATLETGPGRGLPAERQEVTELIEFRQIGDYTPDLTHVVDG